MKKLTLFLVLFTFSNLIILGQEDVREVVYQDETSLGIGSGLEYGILGVNFNYFPIRNIGLSAGLGTSLGFVGWNLGTKITITSSKHKNLFTPYIIGLYGSNSGVIVDNTPSLNNIFYGFSLGVGTDIRFKPRSRSSFSLTLFDSFIPSAFNEYIKSHYIMVTSYPSNIRASIGYKYTLSFKD